MPPPGEITERLLAIREGDEEALGRLVPLVYERLRSLAHARLIGQRPGTSLDTTSLVHEAYLRLVDQTRAEWLDRSHFFAVAATAMRQIIVDRARRRGALKRGGLVRLTTLEESREGSEARVEEILAVHEALDQMKALNARLAKMVELRFFAGFSIPETAEILGIDARTVNRDWRMARALLYRSLSGPAAP
jgi:RNA polymerase sigma factor (TIGR02999 family)